jgi:hypothetical protein
MQLYNPLAELFDSLWHATGGVSRFQGGVPQVLPCFRLLGTGVCSNLERRSLFPRESRAPYPVPCSGAQECQSGSVKCARQYQ